MVADEMSVLTEDATNLHEGMKKFQVETFYFIIVCLHTKT